MRIIYYIHAFDACLLHVSVLVHHNQEEQLWKYLVNQLLLWHCYLWIKFCGFYVMNKNMVQNVCCLLSFILVFACLGISWLFLQILLNQIVVLVLSSVYVTLKAVNQLCLLSVYYFKVFMWYLWSWCIDNIIIVDGFSRNWHSFLPDEGAQTLKHVADTYQMYVSVCVCVCVCACVCVCVCVCVKVIVHLVGIKNVSDISGYL